MIRDPSLILTVDVEGAPVRIGERVRIVPTSPEGSVDERFLGHTGIVVALVFDDPWLQYPADPLIRVRVSGLGEDLFFVRELEGISERAGLLRRASPPTWAC
ncbi:Carotenogenesis protein CarS [Stigmatella hybrida]|uniref:Carotenogenesis protein CarS n=1 Tax=Stigmatella hybrida TaxID=394097 RepID=UPI001CDA5B83|nr:Carotenogenesis protein CarS [Stigmatella hybrida]